MMRLVADEGRVMCKKFMTFQQTMNAANERLFKKVIESQKAMEYKYVLLVQLN